MKKYYAILLLALLAITSCIGHKIDDSTMQKNIVGTWKIKIVGDDHEINSIDTFSPDGTLVQNGQIITADGIQMVTLKSDWKVVDGILISKLINANPEGIYPSGYITKTKITSMNINEFKYESVLGVIQTYERIK